MLHLFGCHALYSWHTSRTLKSVVDSRSMPFFFRSVLLFHLWSYCRLRSAWTCSRNRLTTWRFFIRARILRISGVLYFWRCLCGLWMADDSSSLYLRARESYLQLWHSEVHLTVFANRTRLKSLKTLKLSTVSAVLLVVMLPDSEQSPSLIFISVHITRGSKKRLVTVTHFISLCEPMSTSCMPPFLERNISRQVKQLPERAFAEGSTV